MGGRTQRLKADYLHAPEVGLPPLNYQETVRDTLRQVQTARDLHANLPTWLDTLQSALLDQAYRGELYQPT